MRILLVASLLLLAGCVKPTKPDKPIEITKIVPRKVVCQSRYVPVPELQPVNFTTVIAEGVAWVALSPVEHGSLQTNHARLIGYSKELQAEITQMQKCIDRHNKDTQ